MQRVAIIGAGLAGLVLAHRLNGVADVRVFEKSRGPGGRAATRRIGGYAFDHGTQFFTARTPEFRNFLAPLIEGGVVVDWPARFAEIDAGQIRNQRDWRDGDAHYVAVPGMNGLGKHLAQEVVVNLETQIENVERRADGWCLTDSRAQEYGEFDWLIVTAPAAQTQALVGVSEAPTMLGCYAMMLGFATPLELPWDAAVVRNADISWLAVNSSKPQRGESFTIVVHSTNRWAQDNLELDSGTVLDHMLDVATRQCGHDLAKADVAQLHRWRFANLPRQTGPEYFLDSSNRLAACGDWFIRGRIEAAFTSANRLAEALVRSLRRA